MTAQATDLTTLATLKQWLGLTTQTDDASLSRLLSSVSRSVLSDISNVLLPQTLTRIMDGQGGTAMVLPDFPIISLTSLTIDTVAIPAAADVTQAGWLLRQLSPNEEPSLSEVALIGYRFTRGKQNVKLVVQAGYQASETFTISTPYTYTVLRPWRQDVSVLSGGVAMTPISTGTPTAGQYLAPALSAPPETFTYTFSSADAGKTVTITYGYTPEPVEQAVLELCAKRYREKDRVGQKSMNLGGQVVTYDLSAMTDAVNQMLQPYRKVIPA